ncbi:FAD-binding and (Fe-S)-binding domain-containing protein [Reinekea marina]|uniref:FAD-binding and (Fe-S)-binding domain-containing protein n=1 Tax=Reinekea marina TaxID=1310421 RepID=A0ABV7WWD3_9GAMM|nr:FAD-binding and (Fe-S)-binding domain-containing protein [Reinekea marina]MDN3649991.1 FAD-binding and (Fe-S)-binding domain-containing protein [Reinekea marina]
MLPRLHQLTAVQKTYLDYLDAAKNAGFSGDLNPDYAHRTVLSTDNSIYQVLPQAVVFPKSTADIQTLLTLIAEPQWQHIVLSPRGGGTGTNGQSLTDGIVVDLSKHMNSILEINAEQGWARVQTGVVKDQLNKALKAHNLFFAPELSTSNRATIGGMINTDASGQGSVMYGKTRDHVLELTTALVGGDVIQTQSIEKRKRPQTGTIANLYTVAEDIASRRKDDIAKKFPPLNRCLTGYDLAHIEENEDRINLNNLLCGSEGTLGFITEAKINVLPIPKFAALVNVFYSSFESSLRDAQALMQATPTSIETIDSTVLNLAREDTSWSTVADYFDANEALVDGINLVEYTANSEAELEQGVARLTQLLDQPSATAVGYSIAWGDDAVKKIWAMRKKAVGLLGNAKGEARPVPFVEDTAVPPENLADFIMEFRAVLDANNLRYGMFGHVDAGVLHVRPALDLKDKQQELEIRKITDQVVELVKKYNGLLWGEHGKGVRSEFAPKFFGDLYPELQLIKRTFDPRNQLNPGKIATHEAGIELLKIDEVPTRGSLDRTIPSQSWHHFKEGMYCNGNGACYNFDPNDAMCPSWKVTRDRRFSPKGRASLVREWTRLLGNQGLDTEQLAKKEQLKLPLWHFIPRAWNSFSKKRGQYDFSHEVAESMDACLACKSCTGQCPIKVDVPEFRSKFFQIYYSRYLRPLKDYVVGLLEFMIPVISKQPVKSIYNGLMRNKWITRLLQNVVGMVDSPQLHTLNLRKELRKRKVLFADASMLSALSLVEKNKSVVIVQDAFTSYFETNMVLDCIDLLQTLGFRVWMMPYHANGKPLHVHGFLHTFKWVANRNQRKLSNIAHSGVPMIGMDPAMTLAYRSEYAKYVDAAMPTVLLIQEFLAQHLSVLEENRTQFKPNKATMLGHCTEKTNAPASSAQWVAVFDQLNQRLIQKPVGCCGMAGTFGHETKNKKNSIGIYDLSWREVVANESIETLVATGYSCRSQVKRVDQKSILHPVQFLLKQKI